VDAVAAAAAGAFVRGRWLTLALPVAGALAGCYQPKPLDARSVMNEVAAEPAPGLPKGQGPAPGAVSEDEAVAIAMKSNPDLRAARHQRGIAEGEVVAAGALLNPAVDLDVIHLEDYGTRNAWAIGLRWEPPQPGVYSARRAAARAGAAATEADIAETQWQVAVAVRGAHALVVALEEKRELVEKALAGRRQIAALVEKRIAGGASTRLDLSLAQLDVQRLEQQRDDLATQAVAAAAQLGLLMGTPPPRGATGTLPSEPVMPAALEPLVEEALQSRPALVASEKRYMQREETIRMETARRWPWFRFTAIPRYRADGSDIHPRDYSLGLQLLLPILDQNAGPIQVAEASRDQERELFRKQVVDLRTSLAAARTTLAVRSETLRRYQTSVLPSLEAQEKLLASAVSGGQLDVVALLAASDNILRSRGDYVDVRLDAYRARLELERAVGRRGAGGSPSP
jgi:outer membrane protein TolC